MYQRKRLMPISLIHMHVATNDFGFSSIRLLLSFSADLFLRKSEIRNAHSTKYTSKAMNVSFISNDVTGKPPKEDEKI